MIVKELMHLLSIMPSNAEIDVNVFYQAKDMPLVPLYKGTIKVEDIGTTVLNRHKVQINVCVESGL